MTGAAIAFFVKNPASKAEHKVHYYDIGDDLKTDQKLAKLVKLQSIESLYANGAFEVTHADDSFDWINKRDKSFENFIVLGDKEKGANEKLFDNFTLGVVTNRDAWCYGASKERVTSNIEALIENYNSQLKIFIVSGKGSDDACFDNDFTKTAWTHNLKQEFLRKRKLVFDQSAMRKSVYRPFSKQWVYYDRKLNERVYQLPKIYPASASENLTIAISGIGARSGFGVLMCNMTPNLHTIDTAQNFPLKLYEEVEANDEDLFASEGVENGYRVKDGITDYGLKHFRDVYSNTNLTKEDVFYYVYGLLHSNDYRTRFADNLSKQLPRIPAVKQEVDFWAFSKAGRALGDLHVNYETVEPYPVTIAEGDLRLAHIADPKSYFRVEQMRFAGKRPNLDKTTVIYNSNITMTDIPLAAYDYVVNGKSAIDWVMERQRVKTDKTSGIVNDANDYANETMNDPKYPFELFQRVVTVSLETMQIVNSLPKLEID